jgi:hypothetical protein
MTLGGMFSPPPNELKAQNSHFGRIDGNRAITRYWWVLTIGTDLIMPPH